MMCLLLALAALAVQPASDAFRGRVSGVVVDHLSNRPLNNVLVQMTPVTKSLEELSMLTSGNGGFLFENVLAGKYQLSAQKRGQSPQAFRGHGAYGTAIVVGAGKVSQNIVFSMRAPASISGLLLDDDGNPILNGFVSLLRQMIVEGESTTTVINNSNSDSMGRFHFAHLGTGNYYLAAQGTPWGIQPARTVFPVTFYGDTRDAQAARVIHLSEGDSVQLQMNLHAVPAIEVHIPDARNINPALSVMGPQGARVQVTTGFQTLGDTYTPSPEAAPGTAGSFIAGVPGTNTLSGLAAGRYLITFNHFGPGARTGSSLEMELDEGTTLNADTSIGSTVKGHVTFDGPTDPARLPKIFLYSVEEAPAHTQVNADGAFRFGKLSPGEYEIGMNDPNFAIASVTAEGARMVHGKLQIAAGGLVELAVTATTSKSLSSLDGFAKGATGEVAGVMVLLVPQDLSRARLFRRDQSDSDGSFSMRYILPGQYTLAAIEEGHDLVYKNPQVIRPYLAKGTPLIFPLQSKEQVNTSVQKRIP